jgi:hypothetical protein
LTWALNAPWYARKYRKSLTRQAKPDGGFRILIA